ncbi:SusE domain-containing protein [Lacibacter sediminis]|uniref:SusE domain-containing protein n=1 Tax=Lacibacter sediminis TaxID=2760713 RepID=A0A7G5XHD8_9BACT|nr:SusE domain-containing protein [Lacibacter sediminis]QNA44891.1 SusE domain-containing protein [Lacibacter sediminis]
MKSINKLFILTMLLAVGFAACEKAPGLENYKNGTAVSLTSSAASIAPTAADSNKVILTLNWTSPAYATDSTTYKYILELDSSTKNFTKPNTVIQTGARTKSFTGKEINNMLLNYGFALGVPVDLDFRITSSYSNNNELYKSNIVKIRVTPYNDPSVLTTEKTAVSGTLNTSNDPSNKFTWTNAFTGYNGIVTYTLQYDSATKNFASLKEIAVGASTYLKQLKVGEMNDAALNEGVAGDATGKIEFRVKAVTAQGAVSYSNVVSVNITTYIPLLRFYLPGSYQVGSGYGSENWTPATAPELVRDLRPEALNKLYYIYIWLPANTEFKVTQGRSWDVNYGGTGGNLVQGALDNLKVTNAGYYRISIDRTSLKYDIREGRMGFVGGATGAGWTPPNVFPNYAMGLASTNLFVGVTNLTVDAWKMIDYNDWNSGDINVTNARSYGSAGGSGSTMEVNGGNFPAVATAGRYRAMWDGRNPDNIKYELSPATEMRVVGNGIQGVPDWNPGASPQMTYMGAGKWQITVTLVAGKDIKFLAGNDWGAFDYEDNSGGSIATGVARKIKWEGGDNFKTPAATGSYTIILDEHAQTVTIQ